MTTQHQYEPAKVQYARRPTQGVILGIDKHGLWSISIALAPVLVLVVAQNVLGAFLAAIIMSPLALGGFLKTEAGIPLTAHSLKVLQFTRRKATGMAKYRRKPGPLVKGHLELPGHPNRFEIWETDKGSVVIWDKRSQMASITCVVASPGMAQHSVSVATPQEREGLIAGWMTVVGAWTRRPQIARVTVQERTRPGSIVVEQQQFDAMKKSGPLADSYQEALNLLADEIVWRPSTITITIDTGGGAGRSLVKSHGGGKAGVLAVCEQEMGSTTESLMQAGFTRVAWCTPREWAATGRGTVDPVGETAVDARIGSAFEGVAPELAGPMSLDEDKDYAETDSAFHRTYWVADWPRLQTLPGFMGNVAFAESHLGYAVRHTFSLVGTPVPMKDALKRIANERKTWKQNARFKQDRAGTTIADNADWHNLDAREQDLIDGQGQLEFTGYVVVTAVTFDGLQEACAAMEISAANAGIELLVLAYEQQAGLISVAYPAGMGMK